jgi:2-isopropylmalate synthase
MTAGTDSTLHLQRWTINSGSNVQSRAAVVIASGEHQWEASAEGSGPVEALYRAVDRALSEVLTGEPQLLAFDVRAISEGPDAIGVATVTIAPPVSAAGARSAGRYDGEARSANIVGASVEAYIVAINALLAEEHWAGATESAGNRRRAQESSARGRAEIDRDSGDIDMTDIFNR